MLARPSSACSGASSPNWKLNKRPTDLSSLQVSRQVSRHRNSTVWTSAAEKESLSGWLPPLVKGANRHRSPASLTLQREQQVVAQEIVEVDMETAESIGRNIIGADTNVWVAKVFQASDTSESGYICPAEFTAFVAAFWKQLGHADAAFKMGDRLQFSAADLSLEGRISLGEFALWTKVLTKHFGEQRCVMAAARYLGLREAEQMLRKRVKNVELYQGYNAKASIMLLSACVSHSSSRLLADVESALAKQADPNSALYDPFHRGYTAIICLTLATPTRDGEPIARAIDALVRAGADPFRESGEMPFGKWTPLRFASFMQNQTVLNCMLKHCDSEEAWIGNRFLWAASENVGYIMIEELDKEFNHGEKGESIMKKVKDQENNIFATVLLQQYASPIAPGSLFPQGAKQLLEGTFSSAALPPGSKADPNGPALEGITALMHIVSAGELETAKVLLSGRADPNLQDASGASALHHAAARLQVGIVRTLLEFRAKPWQVDHAGLTPLMLVGEESAHVRVEACRYVPNPEGKFGSQDARRELLDLLRPKHSPEDVLQKLKEDWKSVLDPAYCGLEGSKGENKLDLENLERTFRLHESLFFSCELADGHGAHEGRRERVDLLEPLAAILLDFLRDSHLEGKKKILTRYLLLATMGPSQTNCAHIHSPWPTKDNRARYRERLRKVAVSQLAGYAAECDRIRRRIEDTAHLTPDSKCRALVELPADKVQIPERWKTEGPREERERWKSIEQNNTLRYDPPWALDVGANPARCCMALLRLGTIKDVAGYSALVQVHHAPMAEMFARGYITYSNICNVAFQDKMKEVAKRAIDQYELDVEMPTTPVPAKKLKRLMEKVRERQGELQAAGVDDHDGLDHDYFAHSQTFYILDTVRLAFTCNGKTTEKQVECAMRLVDAFVACTPEKDNIAVLRKKNGFAKGVEGSGGYADIKLLVWADLGTEADKCDGSEIEKKIVGEVQIILKGYMEVKHKMHLVYEVNRGSFDHKKGQD